MKLQMIKTAAIVAMAAGIAMAQTTATATTQPGAGKKAGLHAQVKRRLLKALDLTAAQKQQAKAIAQTAKAQAQPLVQQLKVARQALATAVQTGDEVKIQQAALEAGNLQGQVMAIRSVGRAKFFALLTPDQKAKATEFQQKVKQVLGKGAGGD